MVKNVKNHRTHEFPVDLFGEGHRFVMMCRFNQILSVHFCWLNHHISSCLFVSNTFFVDPQTDAGSILVFVVSRQPLDFINSLFAVSAELPHFCYHSFITWCYIYIYIFNIGRKRSEDVTFPISFPVISHQLPSILCFPLIFPYVSTIFPPIFPPIFPSHKAVPIP